MARLSYVSLFIFLLIANSAISQRIKYKDLIPMLETANDDEAIPMLNEFLLTERDNPNANFRLGLLYAKKYKSTDPLKEYEKAMEYAQRAKLQMVKSKSVVDSRDVNRNQEYYVSVASEVNGSKVEFQVIQQQMDKEYQDALDFIDKLPPVYTSFTKAVANYDLAKKEYAKLAEQYSSRKELLLLYDNDLESRLKALESHYDSTLYYFNLYKEEKKSVNIPYDQNYTILPIKVYRKDGLATQTDFLASTIPLWDYKSWVNDLFAEVNSSINELRQKLEDNQKKISESLQQIKDGSKTKDFVSVDKDLIFELGRYDYQTAIVPLLQYQESQQQYIARKNELTGFNKDTTISIHTRLAFYTELLYNNLNADSILIDLNNKIQNTEKLKRHEIFLQKNFNGIDGLKSYTTEQSNEMQKDYSDFVKSIRDKLGEIEAPVLPEEKSISYQRLSIPLFKSNWNADSLQLNKPVTTYIEFNPDGSRYLSGVIIRDKKTNEREVFIARVDSKEKVSWVKYYNLQIDSLGSPANHSPSVIKPTQEGVLVAIHSMSFDSTLSVNSLAYLSDAGEEIFASKMSQEGVAQFINYDEETRSFLLTYYPEQPDGISDLNFVNVTDSGSVAWEKQLLLRGQVNEVISIYNGDLFLGTGDYFKSEDGELTANDKSLILYTVSLNGNVQKSKLINGFIMKKAIKVNDSNISITALSSGGARPAGSPDFIITNSQLQLLYPGK